MLFVTTLFGCFAFAVLNFPILLAKLLSKLSNVQDHNVEFLRKSQNRTALGERPALVRSFGDHELGS